MAIEKKTKEKDAILQDNKIEATSAAKNTPKEDKEESVTNSVNEFMKDEDLISS